MEGGTPIITSEIVSKVESDNPDVPSHLKRPKRSKFNDLSRKAYINVHDTIHSHGMWSHIGPSDFSDDEENGTSCTQTKNMVSIARIFYARIQKETEEFIQHIENQSRSQEALSSVNARQNFSAEDDNALLKMKYLLMIHTACSNITNLLMHPP